jgi:hypothetical protein
MSCYDCQANQPQGCIKQRPEYETMTECPEYEPDNQEKGESDD